MSAINAETLEPSVQGARAAFACAFANSAEYEADLIRERRAAGAYGPTVRERVLAWTLISGFLLAAAWLVFFAIL